MKPQFFKLFRQVLIIFLIILAVSFFLIGCFVVSLVRNGIFVNSEKAASTRMEDIVSAINAQDTETLKALFSHKALSESEDIDLQIAALIDFLKDDIISWEMDGCPSSETTEYGKRQVIIYPGFIVHTNEENYRVLTTDFPVDSFDRDNKGLYSIIIARVSYSGQYPAIQSRNAGITILIE